MGIDDTFEEFDKDSIRNLAREYPIGGTLATEKSIRYLLKAVGGDSDRVEEVMEYVSTNGALLLTNFSGKARLNVASRALYLIADTLREQPNLDLNDVDDGWKRACGYSELGGTGLGEGLHFNPLTKLEEALRTAHLGIGRGEDPPQIPPTPGDEYWAERFEKY